jgi:hypothetical protein
VSPRDAEVLVRIPASFRKLLGFCLGQSNNIPPARGSPSMAVPASALLYWIFFCQCQCTSFSVKLPTRISSAGRNACTRITPSNFVDQGKNPSTAEPSYTGMRPSGEWYRARLIYLITLRLGRKPPVRIRVKVMHRGEIIFSSETVQIGSQNKTGRRRPGCDACAILCATGLSITRSSLLPYFNLLLQYLWELKHPGLVADVSRGLKTDGECHENQTRPD